MLFSFLRARHVKGFSLIEILLTMALISIVLAASIPAYQKLQSENDLAIAISTLAQSLRLAELKAQAVDEGSGWGIHSESGVITIFKGPTFANRDQTFDETFQFNKKISITSMADIFFVPFFGTPQTPGLWQIKESNQTRSITINQIGTLLY